MPPAQFQQASGHHIHHVQGVFMYRVFYFKTFISFEVSEDQLLIALVRYAVTDDSV